MEEDQQATKASSMIMAALATLTPAHLTHLTTSILAETRRHHRRLLSILSSPALFSLSLHHLSSLSLSSKSHLVSSLLLSSLRLLAAPFDYFSDDTHHQPHRDLDASLLLLLLCDTHRDNPKLISGLTPPSTWREPLRERFIRSVVGDVGSVGVHYGGVLLPYVEMVARCWRFVGVMEGGSTKGEREVAASPAAVVALPAVEVGSGEEEKECVVCKEGMEAGRNVCELPCGHRFHWKCVLPWFHKRNTCPSCRFRLPSEDLVGEIQRLWGLLERAGRPAHGGRVL